MEEYVEIFKKYLNGKRNYTRTIFKIAGTIYRGVTNGRFTFDEGITAMNNLKGGDMDG